MNTIYFAHSMRIYRTPEAKRCLGAVTRYAIKRGMSVLDPENLDWGGLVEKLGSHDRVYDHVIGRSAEVVAREHQDHIGKGIHDEVLRALLAQKPVWRLAPDLKAIHPVIELRIVDAADWKIRYAQLLYKEQGVAI